ncbi:NMDA receptor synaptonuclear signaling and neuronal migration factor isoform X6 [Rhinolophus ferrumequinum]|uniref:NMDA receptor synaptonuclear signaling and neuronal migration factor isoform X6 n=1 Tax=Rhinolophus ferrumequinum TaxID=59479 RepID=UPI00140FBE88|nr:NMDA receptor synaptonuclear signaling and neuronal migration factor isoform X6 [Rhinolophus ferrumequinum]
MGAAASRRRALRSEAMSSVAAKVRAARAFGEYLSQNHPENRNGADHLLADAYSGHDGSPEMQPAPQNKRRLSLVSNGRYEGSLSEEAVMGKPAGEGPQPRVYTISGEPALLSSPEAELIELAVVKGRRQPERHPHHHSQPLRASPDGSHEDVSRPCQSWVGSRQGSKECPGCAQLAPGPSPRAFRLDQPPLPESTGRRKKLERMYSVDRVSDDTPIRTWFPKENLFSFQAATTTMQAVFRGYAERKRRKRENDSASVIQRNFRKHLRMVGSRRVKAQSSDLQSSHCTLGEAFEDLDWETEKGLEAVACDTEGFVPPKVMLISSKVPKAEYIPTIIRRDDPSIIPILYDHEHATFEDILEEIEKKLNIYHKGAKIWKMLIFCQGGPGHLYLLKNKVATFAKVEKEEDMIHFWKRLSRLMSKVNPEPNVIHIMGCYILGNPNGEKLFQNLRTLMTPYRVTFESPLELSAQDDRDLLRLPPVPPVEEPPALEAAGLRGRSVRAGPPPGHVLRRQGLGRGVPDRVSPGRRGHFREASPAQVRAGSGPQPGQGERRPRPGRPRARAGCATPPAVVDISAIFYSLLVNSCSARSWLAQVTRPARPPVRRPRRIDHQHGAALAQSLVGALALLVPLVLSSASAALPREAPSPVGCRASLSPPSRARRSSPLCSSACAATSGGLSRAGAGGRRLGGPRAGHPGHPGHRAVGAGASSQAPETGSCRWWAFSLAWAQWGGFSCI